MDSKDDAYAISLLIYKEKLESAEKLVLEALRKDKTNGKMWFLRGLISLKRNNPNYALEAFNLSKSFGYNNDLLLRGIGYSYFLKLNFEEAKNSFEKVEQKDVNDFFMIAACYIMLKNPNKSREYLVKAYNIDPKRTKQMLIEFYNTFIMPANTLTEKEKSYLLNKIKNIKI